MQREIRKLYSQTKKFLKKYNPLLAKDRLKIIDNYGELAYVYLTAEQMSIETLDSVSLVVLNEIKESISYLLSFVQVEYKSRVALDIMKSLSLWSNHDGGFFYAIPTHQYEILLQTLELASKINSYNYQERTDK